MTDRKKHAPNSQGYTNALLEDVDDKFQTILEATQPIPQIQQDLTGVKERTKAIEKKIDTWEEHVQLIPAIFEEISSLRKDVEIIKEARLGSKAAQQHDFSARPLRTLFTGVSIPYRISTWASSQYRKKSGKPS